MTSGTRIYVGRLSYDVRERDIEKFFKGYGRIREILIKDGFAFVEFDDQRDAEDAVYELNGKEMLGDRVHVEFARGPGRGRGGGRGGFGDRGGGFSGGSRYGPPRNTEYRVIVENLSSRVSWQDLKDFMRQAGEVTYADAHKREKNMGIVDFASYADMKAALEKLDGNDLHGRRIRLQEDKSRRRRTRSRSRSPPARRGGGGGRDVSKSRSRSRSRSASKSRSRSKDRRRSRSESEDRSKSRSRSKSVSKNRREERRSSRNKSVSRSRSRSPPPARPTAADNSGDNGAVNEKNGISSDRERSESRSRSRSPDERKSRSRSPSAASRDSRSRSRSASPDADRNNDRSDHSGAED